MRSFGKFIKSLCLMVMLGAFLILTYSSVDFDLKVTKKKNSFISDVSQAVDSGYSAFKTVKNFVK